MRHREGVSDDPATIEWFQDRAGDLRNELRTGSLTTAEADLFIGELLSAMRNKMVHRSISCGCEAVYLEALPLSFSDSPIARLESSP